MVSGIVLEHFKISHLLYYRSILHDEEAYPDPFSFNPERFIKNGKQDLSIRDPASAAFGFGRRVCPGRHLGMESIWVAISGLLAVYEILPPTHGDPPQCKMTNAIISSVVPFLYAISDAHRNL